MQYVKDLLKDLKRFNPEARVVPEIRIDGPSPATQCNVECWKLDSEIEELEEKLESAEDDRDEANRELEKLNNANEDASYALADIEVELVKESPDLSAIKKYVAKARKLLK